MTRVAISPDLHTHAGQAAHYRAVRARIAAAATRAEAAAATSKPTVRHVYSPFSSVRIGMERAAQERAKAEAIASWGPYPDAAPYDHCDGRPMNFIKPGQQIIREVAEQHGVRVVDMSGPRRDLKIVAARQEAMWRVKMERPDMSLPMIGRLFKRDHTTVLHGIRVHEKRMEAAS